jgi:hypothetical protein
LLVPLIDRENCRALLERATHLTKRQLEELVAELSPRPDVSQSIRKLPLSQVLAATGSPLLETAVPVAGSADRGLRRVETHSAGAELVPGRVGTEGHSAEVLGVP